MYEHFKDQFITNLSQMKINLNKEQIDKILISMDNAAFHYNIYDKDNSRNFKQINGIPQIVYTYLSCKQTEGRTRALSTIIRFCWRYSSVRARKNQKT